MPKIGFFVPTLGGGGAERVFVTLANAFTSRGHDVDLLTADAVGPYKVEVGPSVRIVDLRTGRVHRSLVPLMRYLRSERPYALVSAMTHTNIISILARWGAQVPTKLVVTEHASIGKRMEILGAHHRYLPILARAFYPAADAVVGVSSGVADELVERLHLARDRVTVVPNPIEVARVADLASHTPAHEIFASGAPPVLLAVGRLVPQKDYPTLLRAVAIAKRRRPVRLAILGEGPERPAIEALASRLAPDTLMPGFVAQPFGWMKRARLLVMSSATEGLPTALIEAMACGTPIVSTDCLHGPREILENGKWGRLVPVGDPVALAAAIEASLDDPIRPDVRQRAADFNVTTAVDAYSRLMGLTS